MDWQKLANQAKEVIDKRGGPQSVQEDAEELRNIVQGQGSMTDKLKAAAQALKEPGAHHQPTADASAGAPAAETVPGAAVEGAGGTPDQPQTP